MHAPLAMLLLAFAQISVIPGSAARGAEVFREKACVECHAGNVPHAATPTLLATALWNHSPKMWRAQQGRNFSRPTLDSFETADLFAYFFSLAYFTAPGNAMHGRTVFESAGCANCHDTVANFRGRAAGPPISTWSEVS